jgi:hypothetical protein
MTNTNEQDLTVNVLAFREGEFWVAQCIEFDIAARSDTLEKAMQAFGRVFTANLVVNDQLGRKALDGIPPAPTRFKHMFDSAKSVLDELPRPRRVAELRVLEAA